MYKPNSRVYRKFTWQEVQSWPEIHPNHELLVLQLLLDKLQDEQEYETCQVVKDRMDFLKGISNPYQ